MQGLTLTAIIAIEKYTIQCRFMSVTGARIVGQGHPVILPA